MRNFLMGLWKDESGAAAAEYALILALIAVGIGIAAGLLGDVVDESIRLACNEITDDGANTEFTTDCDSLT
jgi:pilus assembly protein Flp/PilA